MKLLKSFLVSLFLAVQALSQPTTDSQMSKPSTPPPRVEIDFAADAPLRVTAKTKWTETVTQGIELSITVKNTSKKAIRAYATRPVIGADTKKPSCFLLHTIKPGKVLQPGQSELRTTWRGYPSGSQEPVSLFLDFVEFTDDSTWGADICQSAETLAGMRAGARKVVEVLEALFAEGGAQAVHKNLATLTNEIETPRTGSLVWQSGFRSGIDSMVHRLRDVVSSDGFPELGPALKRPFDASGYKIDVVKLATPWNQ